MHPKKRREVVLAQTLGQQETKD